MATGNQLDSDADGYGNACDGDFNQSLPIIGFPDLARFRGMMGQAPEPKCGSCPLPNLP